MPFQWYEASQVSPFALDKSSDININLLAIEQAFINQSAITLSNGSIALSSAGPRRFSIDLTSTPIGTNVTVTMPSDSAVGDPPIVVDLVGTNGQQSGLAPSVVTFNLNGDNLYGVVANGCPFLATAGDSISLVKANNVYWIYSDYNILPLVIQPNSLYPTLNAVHPLYHREVCCIDTSAGALTLNVGSINFPGGQAYILPTGGVPIVIIGTSGENYNGVPGPIAVTGRIMLSLTCIAVNSFTYSFA